MCQSNKWKRGIYRYALTIKALVFIKLFNLVIDLNICDQDESCNMCHPSYGEVNLKLNLDAKQA